jgi:hypothetical protein
MNDTKNPVFISLIEEYKRIQPTSFSTEKYKWQRIKDFQDQYSSYEQGRITFHDLLLNINFGNLVFPVGITVFRDMANNASSDLERMILLLYDETTPLQDRINRYQEEFEKVYRTLPNAGKNTFQDERTISILLTFRYPEKYTFFKNSFYTKLCKQNNLKPNHPGQKLIHYYELVRDFSVNYLAANPEIIEWKNQHLDESCYKDQNNLILIQDIFYTVLDNKSYREKPGNQPMENDTSTGLESSVGNTSPLNLILYGPPGTGKTYSTINHALSIIEGKSTRDIESEPRETVKKRFDTLLQQGQIEFVTFHQSLNYEDFIEGIKPVISEETDNYLKYEIREGIFKRIAKSAAEAAKMQVEIGVSSPVIDDHLLEKSQFFKVSLGDTNNPNDDEIFQYCIANDCISIGWGEKIDFSNVTNESEIRNLFDENHLTQTPKYDFGAFAIKCLKFGMKKDDLVFISNGNYKLRAIAQVTGDYYFNANAGIRHSQFRKVKWLYKELDIPVNEVYQSNFSQQTIYYLYGNKVKRDFFRSGPTTVGKSPKKYVLIIDEINRGNVANIFGELLTLIECDKRWGANEQIELTLPYSGERFSVPENLYLIGTMNTADRSVEALDTALRRRFSFIEMKPRYDLKQLQNEIIQEITLEEILHRLNIRIEKLLDKDHQIGHAYFLGIMDLKGMKNVFANNIFPLLQEYFYGDPGKIALVVGDAFFSMDGEPENHDVLAKIDWYENREDLEERMVIHLKDPGSMPDEEFEEALKIMMS